MAMVGIQTATPTGASAPPPAAPAPTPPAIAADGQAPEVKGIRLTLRALKRIRIAMAKEKISPAAGGLRLGITGGGCSGLSYSIKFDTQKRERDRIFEFSQGFIDPAAANEPAIRVFVDPKSFIYLSGMVLDYEETLMHQAFHFINPHSTKSCGCGSSFST
jgi:iron-sulfur cluster assembly protein